MWQKYNLWLRCVMMNIINTISLQWLTVFLGYFDWLNWYIKTFSILSAICVAGKMLFHESGIVGIRKFTWKILQLNAISAVKFFRGDRELIFLLLVSHDTLDQWFASPLDCKFAHSAGQYTWKSSWCTVIERNKYSQLLFVILLHTTRIAWGNTSI